MNDYNENNYNLNDNNELLNNNIIENQENYISNNNESKVNKSNLINPPNSELINSNINNNYIYKQPYIQKKKNKWATNNPNFGGERLYNEHFRRLEKKEKARKKIKEDLMYEEEQELIFHPKINKISKKLAYNLEEPIEDRLLKLGNQQKEKNLKEQYYKNKKEEERNTFQPTIPLSSQKLALMKKKIRLDEIPLNLSGINPSYIKLKRNKSTDNQIRKTEGYNDNNSSYIYDNNSNENSISFNNSNINKNELKNSYSISERKSQFYERSKTPDNRISRYNTENDKTSFIFHNKIKQIELKPETNLFDYLYLESKIIQDKKEKKIEENMKKNYPFKPNISNKNINKNNKKETKEEFINRLAMNKNQIGELKVLIDKKNKNIEEKEKLFHPTITRGPKNPNQREFSVNVKSDYNKKICQENKDLVNKEVSNGMTKKNIYLKKSMEIIMKTKMEKIKQIFNLLDSDNDGFISSDKIKLSNLNQKILVLITPLLEELQSNQDNMTFKEFYDKAEPLLNNQIFS